MLAKDSSLLFFHRESESFSKGLVAIPIDYIQAHNYDFYNAMSVNPTAAIHLAVQMN